MRNPYQFYAVVLPGLETIAAQELNHLSAHEIREDEGGVHFSGTLDSLYRISLRSRSITRILLRVGKCHAMSAAELQHQIARMRWEHVIPKGASITVKASSEHSKLTHSEQTSEAVKMGIAEALGKRLQKSGDSQQTIYIHINNNRCDIRVDCSGERLDRRGYRLASAKAPIRETLAAGLLQWMGLKADETLYVPMCGSGTFAIEAALMNQRIAANAHHVFPFSDWDIFKEKSWQRVLSRATNMQKPKLLKIHVSDLHEGAIKATKSNAKRADVLSSLVIKQQDIRQLKPQEDHPSGL
ncbi:MAG: RNA methyltransferase, partial [Mariprofundaceae bacterium]|nr:RNA methyltransferase [Mariprofundaceae bacterium]